MYPISCVKSCLFQSGGQKTRKCDQSDIPFHLILSFQNVSLTTSDNRRENMSSFPQWKTYQNLISVIGGVCF